MTSCTSNRSRGRSSAGGETESTGSNTCTQPVPLVSHDGNVSPHCRSSCPRKICGSRENQDGSATESEHVQPPKLQLEPFARVWAKVRRK